MHYNFNHPHGPVFDGMGRMSRPRNVANNTGCALFGIAWIITFLIALAVPISIIICGIWALMYLIENYG
jgi:hypothetical protein